MRIRTFLLILASVTFLTYLSSFWNVFIWDDEQFIYKNLYVRQFALKEIFTTSTTSGAATESNYYRPFTTLSFAIDHAIWGINPTPFHLTNTLFHIAAGLILFYLLYLLGFSKKISFWISLIFLVHPIQTEAVTYINSRGDSLYSFYGFLSLLSFSLLLKSINPSMQIYNLKIVITKYWLIFATVLTYCASILSKEIGITTLGLHFLIASYFFLQSKSDLKKYFKNNYLAVTTFVICLALAIFYLALRATALNFVNSFDFYQNDSLYANNLFVRLLTFCKVVFIYARLLIFPYPLHMERSTTIITTPFNIFPAAFIIIVSLLIFLGWREYKKKKTLYILFGLFWFFCMLASVSGIIPINGILYEHWLYVPMIGFFITIFGILKLLPKKIIFFLKQNASYIGVSIVVVLIVLTIRQNYIWKNAISFYEYLLNFTKTARVYNNLGMAYADDKQYEKALENYHKALEQADSLQTYHNIGNIYRDMGDLDAAIFNYTYAIEKNPQFIYSYVPLIESHVQKKQYDTAFEVIDLAEKAYPGEPTYQLMELRLSQITNNTKRQESTAQEIQDKFKHMPDVLRAAQQITTKK